LQYIFICSRDLFILRIGKGEAGEGEGYLELRVNVCNGSVDALRLVILPVPHLAFLVAVYKLHLVLLAGLAVEPLGGHCIAKAAALSLQYYAGAFLFIKGFFFLDFNVFVRSIGYAFQ